MLTEKDKEYVAELLLGVETDTQDTTGTVLSTRPVTASEEEIREACAVFVGEYQQIPPMYSALKVDGKRLYELARQGKEIERKARPVRISELEILKLELPVVTIRVVCSRGTYIRTLCADIGERLGCGGTMKSLVRTRVGNFSAEGAVTLGELQRLKDEGRLEECLIPVDRIFADCPALHAKGKGLALLENGNPLKPEETEEGSIYGQGQWVRMYRPDESFGAIYGYDEEKHRYHPVKMFLER
jgi:tRNA pseudouridine55 synthase